MPLICSASPSLRRSDRSRSPNRLSIDAPLRGSGTAGESLRDVDAGNGKKRGGRQFEERARQPGVKKLAETRTQSSGAKFIKQLGAVDPARVCRRTPTIVTKKDCSATVR